MAYPLYDPSSGSPWYDVPTGLPIYGAEAAIGRFNYKVRRATWSYRMPDDPNWWTMFESLYDVQELLVSNYGSRSWWNSEWNRSESPSGPVGISFPTGAYNISLDRDREFHLNGFLSGDTLQPGDAYQLYTPSIDFETSVGGWILSGNSVTLSGTGYSGGLSAFGTDLSGAIVDAAGIPISATGTPVDVSSISGGGTFYVLPTNPIISAFEEIDGYVVFDYSKTLVDCSGLTVTAAP